MDRARLSLDTPASHGENFLNGKYQLHFDLDIDMERDELTWSVEISPPLTPHDATLFRIVYAPWLLKENSYA